MIKQLSENVFQSIISDRLKGLQIVYAGLLGGVLSLLGYDYVMSLTVIPPAELLPQPVDLIKGLSFVHAFVCVAMIMLSAFIPAMVIPPSFLNPPPDRPALTEELLFDRFRIIRFAHLIAAESAAIVGLLVCMVGVKTGVAQEYVWVWGNLISSVFFIGYVWRVFPTEDKLMAQFHRLRTQ